MDSDKRGDIELQNVPNGDSDAFSNYASDENRSDVAKDDMDMYRLGKKPEFDRNYQLLSITAFTTVAMVGWIYVPNSTTSALIDGNTGGTITMYLVNFAAFTTITLSLAEMASMAPTAGGQYHWASEFAPPSMQKILSYISGWLSTLAWCCGTISGIFLVGNLIQGIIIELHPNYMPEPWRAYLYTFALISFIFVVNVFLSRKLPKLEGIVFVLMITGYVSSIIVLWVLSSKDRLTTKQVFTTFDQQGGWGNVGLAMMAGQILLVWGLTGSDAAAHMAEETRFASSVIPRAMVWSYIVNGLMVFVMLITYCFCLTNLDQAFDSPTGFPFIAVFEHATGSPGGAVGLTCIQIVLIMFSAINYMASCSRQVWAFARDHGLPFHSWIAKVDRNTNCPTRAVIVVYVFGVLICLISLGSSIGFNAITSVQLLGMIGTYMLSIGCLVWRRLFGKPLPRGAWSLGRFGMAINVLALVYGAFLIVFIPFPVTTPVSPSTLNWSPVIFGGIVLIALVYYLIRGRKVYDGPAAYVHTSY
ncbi:putative amino-acid permease C15C4.04c [Pseudocercospora fuligena]|uniref:Putative amino-acid permease C15C4.04c n=1 Tax=Pseudocercospora fuligena TaxID=685502 RepID=A0A8H6VJK3_9PEZI|nr:putative amino-acid permease C15C4.04c [Pseudocercospora fuligena]